jgi:hypothetical protein
MPLPGASRPPEHVGKRALRPGELIYVASCCVRAKRARQLAVFYEALYNCSGKTSISMKTFLIEEVVPFL